MTENERKAAAYRAAIYGLVKTFQECPNLNDFISAIVVLAKDYEAAQYWAKKEKQEAANNELGE